MSSREVREQITAVAITLACFDAPALSWQLPQIAAVCCFALASNVAGRAATQAGLADRERHVAGNLRETPGEKRVFPVSIESGAEGFGTAHGHVSNTVQIGIEVVQRFEVRHQRLRGFLTYAGHTGYVIH